MLKQYQENVSHVLNNALTVYNKAFNNKITGNNKFMDFIKY